MLRGVFLTGGGHMPATTSPFRRTPEQVQALGSHYVRQGYDPLLLRLIVNAHKAMVQKLEEAKVLDPNIHPKLTLTTAIIDGKISSVFMTKQQYVHFAAELAKTASGEPIVAIRNILMQECKEFRLVPSLTIVVIDDVDTLVVTLDYR
jgi:hypothetical protein